MKIWQHEWYLRNKESINEQHRLYRLNNREKELERHRKYNSNNKGRMKQYYLDNAEFLRGKAKDYRDSNKKYYSDYNKQYREDKKDEIFLRRKQYREDNQEMIRVRKCERYRNHKTDLILNSWFPDSNLHHIEEGVGIYVPVGLHLSVHHVLKSGEGMWEINRKVFEWIIKTGQKVLLPVKTA